MGIFARWARPKGRLPDDLRSQLAAEGILVIEEGVPATIIFSHYRAPGRRGNWQGNYLLAFAMTERRLLVYGATPDRRPPSPFVNVSWDQARPTWTSMVGRWLWRPLASQVRPGCRPGSSARRSDDSDLPR